MMKRQYDITAYVVVNEANGVYAYANVDNGWTARLKDARHHATIPEAQATLEHMAIRMKRPDNLTVKKVITRQSTIFDNHLDIF